MDIHMDCKALHLDDHSHKLKYGAVVMNLPTIDGVDLKGATNEDVQDYYSNLQKEKSRKYKKRSRDEEQNDNDDHHIDKRLRASLTPPPCNQGMHI
jgi:hypothetical protein